MKLLLVPGWGFFRQVWLQPTADREANRRVFECIGSVNIEHRHHWGSGRARRRAGALPDMLTAVQPVDGSLSATMLGGVWKER